MMPMPGLSVTDNGAGSLQVETKQSLLQINSFNLLMISFDFKVVVMISFDFKVVVMIAFDF